MGAQSCGADATERTNTVTDWHLTADGTFDRKRAYERLKAALLALGKQDYEELRTELIWNMGYAAFREMQNEIFKEIGTIRFEQSQST